MIALSTLCQFERTAATAKGQVLAIETGQGGALGIDLRCHWPRWIVSLQASASERQVDRSGRGVLEDFQARLSSR